MIRRLAAHVGAAAEPLQGYAKGSGACHARQPRMKGRSSMVDRLACAAVVVCALGVFRPVTAQEVKTSTALTEQMRSLQDELAKAVSAREASERAAADLRNKLTSAAQAARDGAVALELERARTEVAEEKLHALQAKIEQLEAAITELTKMRVRQAQTAKPAPRVLEGSEPAAIKEYREQREMQRRYESPKP